MEGIACSICRESPCNFESRCGHFFHKRCLKMWFETSKPETTCPCCRTKISSLHRVERFFKEILKGNLENLDVELDDADFLLSVDMKNKKWPFEAIIEKCIEAGWMVDDPLDDIFETFVHKAVKFGRLDLVKFIVSKGADINVSTSALDTPLHLADYIKDKNFEMIKFLVSSGADLEADNEYGITPLFQALIVSNYELSKYLIANGAKTDNETLYSLINDKADFEFIELLLNNGDASHLEFCLEVALEIKDTVLMKKLMDKGANIKKLKFKGMTALQYAAWNRKADLVQFLLDNGVDINERINDNDKSALLYAYDSRSGVNETFKILVTRGADLNIICNQYYPRTIFEEACACNNFEVAEFLLDSGADIFIKTGWQQETFRSLIDEAPKLFKKVKKIILNSDKKDIPILHAISQAVENGTYELFAEFIEKGFDVNVLNFEGETPLFDCSISEIFDEIIKRSVDLNVVNKSGMTAFLIECQNGIFHFEKVLDNEKLDLHVVCKMNRNALHYLVESQDTDYINILIEKGVNYNQLDSEGNSPIFMILTKTINEKRENDSLLDQIEADQLEIIREFEKVGAVFTDPKNYRDYANVNWIIREYIDIYESQQNGKKSKIIEC